MFSGDLPKNDQLRKKYFPLQRQCAKFCEDGHYDGKTEDAWAGCSEE
jgi:hypothetical protein